jgi:hypothetical protein
VDILVIGRDGALKGRFRGEQVADALRLLDQLRGSASL